jgi:large subunit ribosomal protein L10
MDVPQSLISGEDQGSKREVRRFVKGKFWGTGFRSQRHGGGVQGPVRESVGGKENHRVKRSEKERIVEALRARFVPSDVAVLTRFSGLKVSELNRLRNELKKISVDYHVVKNTLVKQAVEGTDIALLRDHFHGPIAIALTRGDIVFLAKALTGYMKDYPKLQIQAGLAQGKVLDAKEVEQAATLPSREELLAKVMYLMNAPLIGLMTVLKEVPAKVTRTIAAIRKQREDQE